MEEQVLSRAIGPLVSALESRLVNAWPSFEVQVCGGWLLRFAKGYSKRANSASPLAPGAALDDALADHIVAQFQKQGLRPTFRLTGLEAPDAEDRLAACGLIAVEPSLVLVMDLTEGAQIDPAITLAPSASARWVSQAAKSYGGDKADHTILSEIVSRIRQQAAFATLDLDGQDVAWGLGVVERGYVGLYDLVVAPELRGLGLGRRLVLSLAAWGREQGARRAYLQVREDNEVARALYGSLGFTPAYRYTHRVMP